MQPPQPPYGGPPPPPGMGGYGPPMGPPGPPGPPGWGPPGPPGPPRRNNNAAIVIVIIAAAVVLIGGGIGIIWLYNKGEDAASAVASPTPSFPTIPSFDTPPVPSLSVPPAPSFPEDTPSAFDPQPGDCVRNTGTFSRPILHDSSCTPGHYRIIDRVDGTTNKNRCNGTGYTYAVWYYSPKFLLCMRRL